jgi:hypothetical protein
MVDWEEMVGNKLEEHEDVEGTEDLESILATFTDEELKILHEQIPFPYKDDDLLEMSREIGGVPEGLDSICSIVQKAISSLRNCKSTEDREEVFLDTAHEIAKRIDELNRKINKKYQRKLTKFHDQFERASRLKELELLSRIGKRSDFVRDADHFQKELETSIYSNDCLSDEAQRVLLDEKFLLATPLDSFDDAFTTEELEEMTGYQPPFSAVARARILRAWATIHKLPTHFGGIAPPCVSGDNPFRFLGWLLTERMSPSWRMRTWSESQSAPFPNVYVSDKIAEAVFSELKVIDSEAALKAVERCLVDAQWSVEGLLKKPEWINPMQVAMGGAKRMFVVTISLKVQGAAEACDIAYDPSLKLPFDPNLKLFPQTWRGKDQQ